MSRKTSPVAGGDTAKIEQYNNLRDEAYASSMFLCMQQATPNLTLKVSPGSCYINGARVDYAGGNSPSFTAPTTHPRIDLLTINSAGTLVRVAGVEAASPEPPSVINTPICLVYNRVGQTSIRETDTTGQGYIYKDVRNFIQTRISNVFGGDGSDGALNISSGTTTIDAGSAKLVIKNYTSISITGTAKLTISNPNANGTILILKSQGDVTITSSVGINLDGKGGAVGNKGWGVPRWANIGSAGASQGATDFTAVTPIRQRVFGLEYDTDVTNDLVRENYIDNPKNIPIFCGSGGMAGSDSSVTVARGGGGLKIECAGNLN